MDQRTIPEIAIDAKDRVILAAVRAKLPKTTVAEAVGLSRAAVSKRIERIRKLATKPECVGSPL